MMLMALTLDKYYVDLGRGTYFSVSSEYLISDPEREVIERSVAILDRARKENHRQIYLFPEALLKEREGEGEIETKSVSQFGGKGPGSEGTKGRIEELTDKNDSALDADRIWMLKIKPNRRIHLYE
ncbi:hypothetical protein ABW19_dt0202004 [Dactylella cylindrospora]|nr:hypothetical protein ABW19_dt0202004 [Dactylella cylindrospora]